MRKPVRLVVLSSVVMTLVALTGPAQASHDYDGMVPTANYAEFCENSTGPRDPLASVCRTDNADLYWYADSHHPGELEDNDFNALRSMLLNEYVPTDLVLAYDSTPVFSGSGETDIIFQESENDGAPLPSGAAGATWCNDAVNGQLYECDQTYVRVRSPDWYRRHGGSVACHETGHAVGLVHGNDASPRVDPGDRRLGCMVNEDEFPSDLGAASTHIINLHY